MSFTGIANGKYSQMATTGSTTINTIQIQRYLLFPIVVFLLNKSKTENSPWIISLFSPSVTFLSHAWAASLSPAAPPPQQRAQRAALDSKEHFAVKKKKKNYVVLVHMWQGTVPGRSLVWLPGVESKGHPKSQHLLPPPTCAQSTHQSYGNVRGDGEDGEGSVLK